MSACRKSLFDTLRHFSELQKVLKNGDHHRAGHPSRVSRTHPSALLTSPAARRRWNPNPSPPSWGGRRAAARRGAPNPRRPGGIVPPRPGVGKGAGPGGLWPPERRPGPAPRRTTGRGRGPDKAGPLRWGGGGRAGPVPARPAPDRPHTLAAQPATFGGGRATATGAAPAAGRFAPETAGGPRGPGAAAYGQGLTEWGAAVPAPGGGGRYG